MLYWASFLCIGCLHCLKNIELRVVRQLGHISSIDLFHGHEIRIGWLVNENHFVMTSPFRNGSHLPTTQCACANFVDFATQRNGHRCREKDL
jgi:hypothetical protein